ncbi:hypothetical protein OROGR_023101 [Orobanche gracilis]
MPSQEILKIHDVKKRVARILVFKIRPSQKILKIRDGTPLEAEEILTYKKGLRNGSVWHFSSKLHVPSNVLQKKRVARILVFKIRPSQEILKIRDGIPLEAKEILIYRKKPSQEILKIRDGTPLELDVPSNVLQKKRVARILVFKIRPSQEILKIRDGTPLEKRKEWHGFWFSKLGHLKKFSKFVTVPLWRRKKFCYTEKNHRNGSIWYFSSKLDVPSNVLQKKRVARILVFKIRPSQEILKIRDGTPLEAEEILKYRKKPSKRIVKKRVARILVFKIRSSQEILKIHDGTPFGGGRNFDIEKSPRNGSVWHFSSKLDVPSNVLQKKRVARILVFKIRPSLEILKIRDVAQILVFKIRPSQEILKIHDGHLKKFSKFVTVPLWSKLDVPSNVLQKKRVARILVFKIRPSQEILKIRDGTPLEKKRVARILVFKIRPSQEILKIRDELGHLKKFSKFVMFSSKLDVPSNVLQKKRVARILVFKIRPSQKILKIRDGTPLEAEEILTYKKGLRNGSVWHFSSKLHVPNNVLQKKRVARILVFKIRPSQEILKIRDGIPLEAKEILIYRKKYSKWISLALF